MFALEKISNLVFEGGGVGAIAYAGFISEAEKIGLLSINDVKRIAGVSSGSIAGLFIALNYSITELAEEMKMMNFNKIINNRNTFISSILRFIRFTFDEGLYAENKLFKYVGNMIKAKTGNENLTFSDLQSMKYQYHFKDLYVVATRLFLLDGQPMAEPFIFSHEHTPYARVVDAICASAALPIIFSPLRLHQESNGRYIKHPDGHLYVDGGIIKNYPIRIFDFLRYTENKNIINHDTKAIMFNSQTIGLRLEKPTNVSLLQKGNIDSKEKVIKSHLQYAEAILYVLRSGQQEALYASSADQKRTIIIDNLGITSTDFTLTKQQKVALLKSGKKAAIQAENMLKSPG